MEERGGLGVFLMRNVAGMRVKVRVLQIFRSARR